MIKIIKSKDVDNILELDLDQHPKNYFYNLKDLKVIKIIFVMAKGETVRSQGR